MAGALEGIKVLDLTIWYLGPMCAGILGDWGAEVIHIEDVTGDPTRGIRAAGVVPVGETNWPWEILNRNKKSITIDLRQERGQEILYKLAGRADVFVTNFLGSVLKRMKIDYESLSQINPKLIYAQGSGYGERGSDKERPGYDFTAFWARSGIMATLGEPGSPPTPQLPGMGDFISALCLAGGISTALFAREKTGKGQKVSLSLLGAGLWMGGSQAQATLSTGIEFARVSRKTVGNPLWNYYQTGDKKWIQLVCLQSDRYWPGFCKAAGRKYLEHDPRFDSHENRMRNNVALISIIDEVMLTMTRDEWGKLFDENGLLWGPALTYAEAINDPQVLENEYIVEVPHPRYGSIKLIASPLQFNRTPAKIRSTAPECGQHTEEILLELGYSWEDMLGLKDRKVIA